MSLVYMALILLGAVYLVLLWTGETSANCFRFIDRFVPRVPACPEFLSWSGPQIPRDVSTNSANYELCNDEDDGSINGSKSNGDTVAEGGAGVDTRLGRSGRSGRSGLSGSVVSPGAVLSWEDINLWVPELGCRGEKQVIQSVSGVAGPLHASDAMSDELMGHMGDGNMGRKKRAGAPVGTPGDERAAPPPPPLRGDVCALMGPSGAGKTSLLDILAGRKNQGRTTGTVALNGNTLSPKERREVSGYVGITNHQLWAALCPLLLVHKLLHSPLSSPPSSPLSSPLPFRYVVQEDILPAMLTVMVSWTFNPTHFPIPILSKKQSKQKRKIQHSKRVK